MEMNGISVEKKEFHTQSAEDNSLSLALFNCSCYCGTT